MRRITVIARAPLFRLILLGTGQDMLRQQYIFQPGQSAVQPLTDLRLN
jgi:hypothetical protein